ncbi:RHS repeat domain-containing protein [Halocynthiibacter sp.]|uniref:RHS repeat domain-containing protein n=1 Tax=Halocynthiibacter sp. TaxID=1979210 RepID=UPI003C34A925
MVTDHLGTPGELFDEAGDVLWSRKGTLWGNTLATRRLVAANDNAGYQTCLLRFQGQIEDEETGFCYNRFRYYDADGGAYLSSDPIRLAGGIRVNGYVVNPTGWIDPLGLAGCPVYNPGSKRWHDSETGQFAKTPNVAKLPPLKGKSVTQVEKILGDNGYTLANPNNQRNSRWVHPDGSEVAIHKYGNQSTTPYKSGNNAHIHKSTGRHQPHGPNELNDSGLPSSIAEETHIGIKNPADYPTISGRPHGT